jgi:transcriptional regulator with XRE-family HTH domain
MTRSPIEGRIPVLAQGYIDPRVAQGIRRIRMERGWSLDDVALRLGCDRSRVSRIERGQRGTPVPALVADALGVPLDHLLAPCPRCDDKPPYGYRCLRCGAETTA